MAVVTLIVNDQIVTAQEGESLLNVLREQGIEIPTLCHLDGLSERGGCRLCMVEIEGSNRLQASCVTKVQEGMVVHTHTDQLVAYRKMLLQSQAWTMCVMTICIPTCQWMPAMIALYWIIIAASYAPAAYASVTR